jgi:hypothetical protein
MSLGALNFLGSEIMSESERIRKKLFHFAAINNGFPSKIILGKKQEIELINNLNNAFRMKHKKDDIRTFYGIIIKWSNEQDKAEIVP